MRNTKIYLSLFILLLVQIVQAQNELDSYLKIAAENNPGLKAKFSDYMATMEKVPQVTALPDPQVAFGYFISTPETRVGPQNWNVSLTQQFPWFGLLKKQGDAATNMAKAKYEEFENEKSNLFFEVKTTYYNYYFINKAIAITRENLSILQTFKNISLIKIEAGKSTIADELRVEIEINDLENQLFLMLDKKSTLQVKFNNLLNQEVDLLAPENLAQDEMPFDKQITLDSILLANHTIKSIDFKMDAFTSKEETAKKMGMPKFGVGVSYTSVGKGTSTMALSSNDNGKDILMFPMVSVTIPLYRKKYSSMIREAQYEQEVQTHLKNEVKNKLTTIYENIATDFNDADRRIDLNIKQAELAKKALNVLMSSYSTDAKDFDEVLRMERQLLKYELEKEKAIIDKNAAVAFTNYLLGM
ncbi:MAG: TolC family protein [Bacteroidetes bacterium]|nr:TolC family protein [Bacteroidota bacterium]